MVQRGVVHDYRIDQGKIVSVRQGTIELLERDGTRQLIPVSPAAQILLNGRFASLGPVMLRLNAITVRDGDEPAHICSRDGVAAK